MFRSFKVAVKAFVRERERAFYNKKLPFKNYTPSSQGVKYIDMLEDEDLKKLNNILEWNCFTIDGLGRRFGRAAWGNKRVDPEDIPDTRIIKFHERFNLSDMHELEVGCFEGIHTLGLLTYTKQVSALDSRIDHVVKTIVRCGMYGYSPTVFKYDLELVPANIDMLGADLMHHVGVLYHLQDPVRHLLDIGRYIKRGIMLDTHFSLSEEATEKYQVQGKDYRFKRYIEYGRGEAFSGMYGHSKWLLLKDIIDCLKETGFNRVEVIEERKERNGPRVLLFAERK